MFFSGYSFEDCYSFDLINQSDAIDAAVGFELRDNLVDGTDYILLTEEIWNQLRAW